MIRRPLVLALALVLLPAVASAEDLLQTYELARSGDPQLSAAEANRLAVREGAVQARAALLPQINGSATLNRSRTDGSSAQTDFDPVTGQPVVRRFSIESETTTRNVGVQAGQVLFDFGRFSSLRSQRALGAASDFQLESANDNLITRTSAAYFTVLVQLETLAAAEAAEAALKRQLDFAEKRLEVGLAPITDVHEARAQYDSARASTILARNAVEDAYQALAEITGQPIRDLKGLPEDFTPALPEDKGVEEWVQTALANNPALRAKELQVRSAEADVQTARAGHMPTLYLSGSYGEQASWGDRTFGSLTIPSDSEGSGPSVGLTLSVPIFSGGATQSRVRQALARRDAAQDELEQQRRALVRNTRAAYQALVAGISEVEARRLAVVAARSAYEASQVGLEVGTRTVLDVLANQRNLFQAQQAYAQARYNFLQARLALEQTAGTLDVEDVQAINRLLTADITVPANDAVSR